MTTHGDDVGTRSGFRSTRVLLQRWKELMRSQLKTALLERFGEVALYLRSGSARTARRYARYRRRLPIAEKTVLFEAYHGARISCVPYALFKTMLEDPYFDEFSFVWTFNPHDDGGNLIHEKYKSHPRVKFYPRHSAGYLTHLASAKYLVNNKTFHHYFSKRPEQVHLTSWHATAFKTLGKDQYGSMGQYGNVARNYLQADYLVMPNRFTADVLLDSCDVRSVFPGMVVDAGYPRSDLTLNADEAAVRRQLGDLLGIDPAKRTVLYAPTWRGEVGAAVDTSDVIVDKITALSEGLPDGYQLLLKVHDRTYQFAKANPALQSLANVPDWFETNELLAAVDVLITDYSSICFDFLCLNRPVIHYVFDREEYERTRGLYFDMETEMAGPLCYTAEEVNAAIANIEAVSAQYRDRHARLVQRLAYNEDGCASKRVLDIVFKGTGLEYAYRVEDTSKTRVLAYAARPTADNAQVLDALSGLDFERVDVALLFDGAPSKREEYYLTKLHPAIKVFYRSSTPLRGFISRSAKRAARAGASSRHISPESAVRWREELLGAIPFDVAVDFRGTATMWQLMFAHTPFGKKVVFLPEPYAGSKTAFPLSFIASHFDHLVCTTSAALEFYSERLAGSGDDAKLMLRHVPPGITSLLAGARADLAHLLGAVGYCIESTAASLDPYCETGDLLFEFRVGGVMSADLSEHPSLSRALDEHTVELGEGFERFARSCGQESSQAESAFSELFSLEAARAGGDE